MSLAIDVRNLSRSFGQKKAVDNLNLQVESGEIYSFLGPNGAGKSTTIKMLVTLLAPTSGDAFICGQSLKHQANKVRLLIGVALQEASLDNSQTGFELLWLQGRLYGLNRSTIENRIKELTSLINIGEALKKPIKTYSGGMKRRLDLAASIIHNPKVLFLDEPTTGLDPISRAKVWSEVKKLNQELGITIFLTTQYLEEADQLAQRVGIINQGKLVAEGTPEDLKKSVGQDLVIVKLKQPSISITSLLKEIPGVDKVDLHDNEVTVVAKDGPAIIGQVAVKLNASDIAIESLIMRTTTLDDVFLEVTGNRLENKT